MNIGYRRILYYINIVNKVKRQVVSLVMNKDGADKTGSFLLIGRNSLFPILIKRLIIRRNVENQGTRSIVAMPDKLIFVVSLNKEGR